MAAKSYRTSDSQPGRGSIPPSVSFARRTSSGRYVNLSRDSLDSEISGIEFSNYTVQIPPTPDNQPMDPSMSQRVEEQYVSSSLFTGGYNSVTRAHLMDKVIESETSHPQMAGAKGSLCSVPGCDGKVMSDERGCKELYKNTDLAANDVEPGRPLPLPSNVGMSKMERRLSLMKSANPLSTNKESVRAEEEPNGGGF
ncbi:Cellulose synthase-like protein D3 [Abeliophyllum distichum]|uniref:Cellulose synthase-like protein D3 n=1 Tax=Abeliophyllum distichum TaxID=126358 RepID=A0ABD1UJY5_9LAMI